MFVLFPRHGVLLLPVSSPYLVRLHERKEADENRSETKQKSLEEIAASFGDKVVLLTEMEVAVEANIQQNKGGADKLEVEDRSVDKVV